MPTLHLGQAQACENSLDNNTTVPFRLCKICQYYSVLRDRLIHHVRLQSKDLSFEATLVPNGLKQELVPSKHYLFVSLFLVLHLTFNTSTQSTMTTTSATAPAATIGDSAGGKQ